MLQKLWSAMTRQGTGRTVSVVVSLAIVAQGLTVWHYRAKREADATTILTRQAESLADRSETFGKADAAVIGDSVLGSAYVDCGRTFYATVPAIRSRDMASSALAVLSHTSPTVAIIGIGTNDQRDLGSPADLTTFTRWRGRVIWVETANSPETNAAMRKLAKLRGDMVYTFAGTTVDGIHPDKAGRAKLSADLSQLCRQLVASRK